MDLNTDDLDEPVELSKLEQMIVNFFCFTIVSLPALTILKMKVYDPYFHVIKSFLINAF